ncbi:MAG: hypothetical protein AAFN59_06355 [Pseudomonadota bacterium]
MKVTHEIHERRYSRNLGVGLVLVGFIAVIFGLTVVKVQHLGATQAFDHVVRPEMLPADPQ